MELINVKRYNPEHKPYGENVQYFQSEDGRDFYESIPLFTKKYKLCISPVT
ncbi:phage tail protein, partial [Escherichia coli]|nr:phage tail protein [Escherichia coli]